MAKVKFTIEDVPDKEKVHIEFEPKISEMMARHRAGLRLTSAEKYAFACYNAIFKISQSFQKSKLKDIILPQGPGLRL